MAMENGMPIKTKYASLEEIPADLTIQDMFEERDGAFVLKRIEGVPTPDEHQSVLTGRTKEREDHAKTKEKLRKFEGLDPDEVRTKLDRIEELEALASDSGDVEERIKKAVDARIKSATAPLERERDGLIKERDDLASSVTEFSVKEQRRIKHDALRDAGRKSKIVPEAEQDLLMLGEQVLTIGEDGSIAVGENPYGIREGLSPELMMDELREKRRHWFPPSQSGGASGGAGGGVTGNNPWKGDNLTEQSKFIKEHGMEKAKKFAQAAGKTI